MARGFRSPKFQELSAREVDLGLASLIGDGQAESGTHAPTKEESPEIYSTIYSTLAAGLEWEKLGTHCETVLESFGEERESLESLEARLWWIRSQLMLGSVPKAILAAPLDAVQRSLNNHRALGADPESRITALEELASSLTRDFGAREGESEVAQLIGEQHTSAAPAIDGRSWSPRLSYRSFHSWHALTLGALLIVLVGVFFYRDASTLFHTRVRGAQSATQLSLVDTKITAQLLAPTVEPVLRLSHLDAIYYDMANSSEPGALSGQHGGPLIKDVPPQVVAKAETPRERVDTSGPLEDAQLVTARQNPERPTHGSVTDQRRDSNGDEGTTYDGRKLFGEPNENPTRLAEAPTFQDYAGPRIYSILTTTKVMPTASTRGVPLAELVVGDNVSAIGQEGYWLKIRSKQGRTGYILSQDAVLERDLRR